MNVAGDPRMAQDFGTRMSLLVWWPVVQLVRAYDNRLTALLRRHQAKEFPDGSVCVDSTGGIVELWEFLEGYGRSGFKYRYNTIFRSLACFEPREYQLLTTWEYFERIGGGADFLVAPVRWRDVIDVTEHAPASLPVRVRFHKRPPIEVVSDLATAVATWSQSVRGQGVFGRTGAAYMIPESFRCKGSVCYFSVNVAEENQATVNWLTLSMLNFGAKRWPISVVGFANQ